MKTSPRIPEFVWRLMRVLNRFQINTYKDGGKRGQLVLLLTTTGRKTSLSRVTPLQYEEENGIFYVASARGQKADWFRNILADPHVKVQVKDKCFQGLAEPITDPERIADFLELRIKRHPKMVRVLLRVEGLPANFSRVELEHFAAEKALVAIRPTKIAPES